MPRRRPRRLDHILGIGVDKMGNLADAASGQDYLRLENLDVDIPPDPEALSYSELALRQDQNNSYLPFTGQAHLRDVAVEHVSRLSGLHYDGQRNCTISAGGLSGILNVLMATVEEGDEVIMTDPMYRGLINRVLLAGGIPKYVPFTFQPGGNWKLDREALRSAVTSKTTAMLLMSPSMPSGGYLDDQDWNLVSELCVSNDLLLINDTAMERLVFDNRPVINPAGLPGMTERTITVGSSAKELRMIGWRVGWIVGPEDTMKDVAAVSMANVVVPVGIAQEAVAIALERSWGPKSSSESDSGSNMSTNMAEYVAELQARRDIIVSELEGLPVGIPGGGWSLLLRVSDFGIDGNEASRRLLEQGVCATSMDGWGGSDAGKYIRFVFSNEPRNRLRGLGAKVWRALESS
ncbi:putative aminotransferase [Cadophora sp. DSE1049]|nr:putative aminotransferase [Cadophora sp. DSE1049]